MEIIKQATREYGIDLSKEREIKRDRSVQYLFKRNLATRDRERSTEYLSMIVRRTLKIDGSSQNNRTYTDDRQ